METFFIFGAKYLYILSALIFVLLFFKSKEKYKFIIFSLVTFALAYALALITRATYFDPRPFAIGNFLPLIPHAADNGFVSDHTLLVSAIASVAGFYHKRWALYLWLIVAIVAMSRVYVGVHHLQDVVASIVIALIAAFVAKFLLNKSRMV